MYDRLHDHLSVLQENQEPEENLHHDVVVLLCRISELLIQIYDRSEEYSEASYYRMRLVTLRSLHSAPDNDFDLVQEAHDFVSMSLRVSEAFHALNLPEKCTRLMPRLENIFPATHLAVCNGRPATACAIVREEGYKTLDMDVLSRTPGHLAAETGNASLLQSVYAFPIEPDAQRDIYNMTALCIAAYMGDLDIFKALHQAGHGLDVRDAADRSVLCIAAGAGHPDIVEYILSHGYGPNEGYNLEQGRLHQPHTYSPLHAAAAGGYIEVAQILLKHKASTVYICNDRTPAQEALSSGHLQLADILSKAEEEEQKTLGTLGTTLQQIRAERRRTTADFLHDLESSVAASTSTSSQASASPAPAMLLCRSTASQQSGHSSARPSPTPSDNLSSTSTGHARKRKASSKSRLKP